MTTIKIGFDAKRVVRNATGLGNYCRTLVQDLNNVVPDDWQLRLYVPDAGRDDLRQQLTETHRLQFVYPRRRQMKPLRSLWRIGPIVKDLQRDGVQLYHGLTGELPMGIRKAGIKTVVTIHDLIFMRHPEYYHGIDVKIYAWKFRQTLREADRIIAISERTRRDIIELGGINDDCIDVVYQSCSPRFAIDVTPQQANEVRQRYNLPQRFILSVGTIEPRKNIAEAEIELTFQNGHLSKKDIKGEIVSVLDEEIDQQMMDHFQTKIDQVKAYVDRKIGRFEHPIYTRESFFGNSAFTDLIHNLQMQISKADISFNAPLSFNTTIQAGDVTQGDMFKLYRFENLLYVLRMTGEEIRKHLEFSYDMWTNTMKSPEDHALLLNDNSKEDQQRTGFQYYTFNFDSACGIDYEVDLTKPDGQKVHILQLSNGQPFDEKKWYKVVMNSYRANGGGELLTRGAGIPKDSLEGRVLFHTPLDQRYYLTQEIEQMGTIDPRPNHNWRFVPEAWVKPALRRDSLLLFGR